MSVGVAALKSFRSTPILDYYRCADIPALDVAGNLGQSTGFFRFGNDVICYGQTMGQTCSKVHRELFDASRYVTADNGRLLLPFDLTQVVDNLRYECYVQSGRRWMEKSWIKNIYYSLRPWLPIAARKHLQQIYLQG